MMSADKVSGVRSEIYPPDAEPPVVDNLMLIPAELFYLSVQKWGKHVDLTFLLANNIFQRAASNYRGVSRVDLGR